MIRFFSLLVGIILALSVTAAYGAETLVCKYKEQFKDGGSRDAGLELTVEGGEVTGIDYHNAIASGKEGGGYVCAFDARASDGKSVWTRKKDLTVVELTESVGIRKSTFEIRKSPKGYIVSFVDMSSQYCGFGAEFPVSVRIERGRKSCRMKFE
ncbi:MAG TPA: hypothetical protein VF827_05385 [Syntrophales bacterium]